MDYRTLHAKTVADLRLLAKQNGVKLPVGANKMRIVELILQKERMNAEEALIEKNTAEENRNAENTDIEIKKEKNEPAMRGRPPKKRIETSETKLSVAKETEQTAVKEEDVSKPAPKKRGRPPKIKPIEETEKALKEDKPEAIRDEKKKSETEIPEKALKAEEPAQEPEASVQEKAQIKAEADAKANKERQGEEKDESVGKNEEKNESPRARTFVRGYPNGKINNGFVRRTPSENYERPSFRQDARKAAPVNSQDSGAVLDRTCRKAPETQQENAPRRELYGENGMGTSNAAVAVMLQNNECMEGAGVLEMHPEGYGFLRAENYLPGTNDVYVSIAQIRRFGLRNGDYVVGKTRPQREGDRYTGLVFINTVNGEKPDKLFGRPRFEDLTPVYPDSRICLETKNGENDLALRSVDLIAPIGKGQRGMIVSPPKAGKTVLIKKIANAITENHPEIHLIVLLIDERPEEVTDMKRSIKGEVVYSTFDETPENHTRLSEMTLDRAERLVEMGKDVVVLMDSITRLARAYNLVIPPTGRSLSGGLDPGALHKPKRFFGAARNIENGGSLTIIATALVETGSRMDDIIYEEFKGTGNMELHLDRRLSERRIFPAIDLNKSGTRRDELLLSEKEVDCALSIRRMLSSTSNQDTTEQLIGLMEKTRDNEAFIARMKGWVNVWQKEGYTLNS